ncbi:uncharacterized protein DUF4129 [Labedaea rhizosphaerae]|uniref:Uncharacterized protein DUF4129 n=1 Tax=Labedaea rhizosphaerae TaxID=598644 RepID=A0A4R6SIW8_LABRH|nr:uncharacterized protein DUF4129 [Labedaea rhizosphaerae]
MLPGVKARLPLLLAMAAMLLIAVVASRGQSAVHPGSNTFLPVHDDRPSSPVSTTDEHPNMVVSTLAAIGFTGLLLVFGALFVLGVVVIVMGVSWTKVRRGKVSNPVVLGEPDDGLDGTAADGTVLRSAIAAAQRDLAQRRSGPPSDAVVAAWLRLEQAAAESGRPRAAHQTPTEFTSALLAEHVADDAAVGRLRGLYQRARFGRPGAVTDADADEARSALGAILDGWRVPA